MNGDLGGRRSPLLSLVHKFRSQKHRGVVRAESAVKEVEGLAIRSLSHKWATQVKAEMSRRLHCQTQRVRNEEKNDHQTLKGR